MKPNQFQSDVFSFLKNETGHAVVRARAGTGKTSTILEALKYIPRTKSVLFCAFNKKIQVELAERVKKAGFQNVTVVTLHSLGYQCIRRQLGGVTIDDGGSKPNKLRKITRQYLEDVNCQYLAGRQAALLRLVSLAKNTLAYDLPDLESLCYAYNIRDEDHPAPVLARQAQEILDRCEADRATIDFDDMIWFPARMNLLPRIFDFVFVDEAQDLNEAQLWLVKNAVRGDESRLVAVGDDRQSIYGFRGAGSNVLDVIVKMFDAEVLPLSETFRCPKLVVEEVTHIVPDYVAHDSAPKGTVNLTNVPQLMREVKRGDFILSRTNAPLMPICMKLLANNVPARIEGKDIGKSLAALIKKSKAGTVKELTEFLQKYESRERDRLLPDQETAYEATLDRIACIEALCEGEEKVLPVIQRIETLFQDRTSMGSVCLSTVHKAKGLERKRVWMLTDTFRPGVSTEEDNIYYVACTRAQEALYFVQIQGAA